MSGATTAVNLTNSTVSNNTAAVTAGTGVAITGGINCEGGTLTLTESTVSGNTAGIIGGIRLLSIGSATTANINRSAITGNTSSADSFGGVFAISNGTAAANVNLNNSTVSGNIARASGGGVGAQANNAGNTIVNINFSTIANNTADSDSSGGTDGGGGIANLGQTTTGQTGTSTVNLKNSVVADNTSTGGGAPDISGVITSQNYNHIENVTGGTFTPATGDVTGTDPALGALALNGGTTSNHLPDGGSPVIDQIPAGVNDCGVAPFDVDQRNVMRPIDSNGDATAACEKGSVERVSSPTAATVSVSGRVVFGRRRGAANVKVVMTDQNGQTRVARTSAFGYYQFNDVYVGETYVFSVSSERFYFVPQALTILDETVNLNFVPQ